MRRAQPGGPCQRVEAARLGVGAQEAGDGLDCGVDVDAGDVVLAVEERPPGGEQEVGEARVEQREVVLLGVVQLAQEPVEVFRVP